LANFLWRVHIHTPRVCCPGLKYTDFYSSAETSVLVNNVTSRPYGFEYIPAAPGGSTGSGAGAASASGSGAGSSADAAAAAVADGVASSAANSGYSVFLDVNAKQSQVQQHKNSRYE
jgi:hypothetical protein